MRKLMTRKEICALLCIEYGKLNKMMNADEFIPSVYGKGKKLAFCPDAVEAWIKSRQQMVTPTPAPSKQKKRDKKSFDERQAVADAVIQRHATGR